MKTLGTLSLILGLLFVSAVLGGDAPPPVAGVEILFVLSARELPEQTFGTKPDAIVELTYFRSPDQPPEYFTNKTTSVGESFNPEWPDVFQITFFEGHLQKIRFVVKHGKKEEIGKVTVSLLEISKAKGGMLEKDIIGKKPTNGRLIIHFIMNKMTKDDTDPRLIDTPKDVKVLKRIIETIDR